MYELLDMKTRVRGLWVGLDMSTKTRRQECGDCGRGWMCPPRHNGEDLSVAGYKNKSAGNVEGAGYFRDSRSTGNL
ncbi:hypothetical protein RRG08_012291 [Elysia crispata]|uniref:Uncharacterized protein n=1 Tax=Elysia crispata TaxID=231223 RepID=A0AAE1BAW5_9GAST|nr:hypothetical protein RRG08_012291 [Elysia crispata]